MPLKVSKNVVNLIKDLRLRHGKRFLCTDAVCIDQDDPEEYSRQIMKVRQIYQRPHSIIIWLPSDGESDKTLIAFIAARWPDEKVIK